MAYGGFEIEHFKPKGRREFRKERNRYTNLLWACRSCNGAKSDHWPSPEEEKAGYRFVDPTKEGLGEYVEVRGDRAIALGGNRAGEYVIDTINLNSKVHIQRRQKRLDRIRKLETLHALVSIQKKKLKEGGFSESVRSTLQASVEQAESQIDSIKRSIDGRAPWDVPSGCLCQQR